MDKEEFRIKLEEINRLVEQKDYKSAMNVVDSIDWRRVKNVRTLCVVGEIYAANKRYEDSKEIFLLAYHRSSIGKNILYRLVEVSLKMGDIEEAMEFFEEFREVAPNDNTQYILKYKIYKEKGTPLSEQIQILEEYKEKEFTERWSYELATLYYRAGDKEKCLDLCNEIILWFSEGTYVMKSFDLKMRMGELTGVEKEKYEQQFVPKLITPEEAKALKQQETGDKKEDKLQEEQTEQAESSEINKEEDSDNIESLQEKISKGIRDIFGSRVRDEEFAEESMEDSESVREEMLKIPSENDDYENVPELEPEDGKSADERKETVSESKEAQIENQEEEQKQEQSEETKIDFSQTIRMPELKIPKSMKNFVVEENKSEDKSAKESKVESEIESKVEPESADSSDFVAEPEKKENSKDFDFNLEDTILAAATAQGIEIPDNPPQSIVELEEEEFLSEEDLQEAEDEFLNGPAARKNKSADQEQQDSSMEPEEVISDDHDSYLNDFMDESDDGFEEKSEKQEPSEVPHAKKLVIEEPKKQPKLTQEEELEQFIKSIQPKEERNPLDIVPREKELREEEKKLFTYFVKVPGMKDQLIHTLCDAQMAASDKTSKTGNIIVMGGKNTGKTRLISSLIPAICKELNLEASKVAYVFAEQINGKDIARIVTKLSGGFLVIENANQLTQETVNQLDRAMEFRTDGLTVILEDEKIGMRKMMARFPKFSKKFTSIINIPVFTNDELVNFAKVYTKENGYIIDQMGLLALYNQIGLNQKEDEPMNIGGVKYLVDSAIAKSKSGIKMFKRSKKRVDRDGFNILFEKDFS